MHALRTRPQGSEVNKEGEGPAKESGGVAPLVPGDVIAKLMDKPGGQTCQPHCCSEHNGASCISQEFTRQHWLLGGSVETFIVGVMPIRARTLINAFRDGRVEWEVASFDMRLLNLSRYYTSCFRV